ncbi:MAG: hypothetical protein WA418_13690, partial [Bradyrhizobium sp.]
MASQLEPQRVGPGVFAAGFAVWAAAAAVFFRHPLISSFATVLGDQFDGRMNLYLHEHLFRALQGKAQFLSPGIFYPQPHVLGFSDGFLLDTIPYSLVRLTGIDAFLAFQLVTIALSLVCFAASLVVGVRYLKLRPALAIAAAVLVTFPNNLYLKAGGHLQFFALYYIPPIVLLALWGLEDFPRVTMRALVRIAAAALLFALLFATAYYVAWLFALTLLIAACAAAILLRRDVVAFTRAHRKPIAIMLAVAGAAFAVGLVPFALIYGPVLPIVSGRSFWEYRLYAPLPKDMINVGTGNLVWGWLMERLLSERGGEFNVAVTPGMTAILLVLALRLRAQGTQGAMAWQRLLVVTCIVVWFMAWVLTVRIGNVSGFRILFQLVPGATAIRVGGRIQLLVNAWVVVGLTLVLERWLASAPVHLLRGRQLIAAALVAFCLIEQIGVMNNANMQRARDLAILAAVPEPPRDCRAFLIDRPLQNSIIDNLGDAADAMWIAHKTGLPTLNGQSGWFPTGWKLIEPTVDYESAARAWIAQTGLKEQVCLYDRPSRTWTKFSP